MVASRTRCTGGKLLCSLGALAAAASVATLGSWASFTNTTSATPRTSAGTVAATLAEPGSGSGRLTLAAMGIAPGGSIQHAVTLSNGGSLPWASAALTTTATTSSLLDSDPTNGLQMAVDSCSVPWAESGARPAYIYTCSGTLTSMISSRAVIGSTMDLGPLASLGVNGVDHMRVTLRLPASAGNAFQGLASAIRFSFVARG